MWLTSTPRSLVSHSWPSVHTYKDSLCSAHFTDTVLKGCGQDRAHRCTPGPWQASPHGGCAPNSALNPSSRRDLFHGLTTALPSPEETTHHHSFFFGSNPRAQRAWFSSSAPTSSFYKVFAFCSHELKTLQGTPLVSQCRGMAGRETEPCAGGI